MAVSASIQALIAGETVAGSRISNRLLTELIQESLYMDRENRIVPTISKH